MFLKERIVRKEKTAQFRREAKRGREPFLMLNALLFWVYRVDEE